MEKILLFVSIVLIVYSIAVTFAFIVSRSNNSWLNEVIKHLKAENARLTADSFPSLNDSRGELKNV